MNSNCEFCGDGCCLCSACQSIRKAVEDTEKVTLKESRDIFHEMEMMLKDCYGDNEV